MAFFSLGGGLGQGDFDPTSSVIQKSVLVLALHALVQFEKQRVPNTNGLLVIYGHQ